MPPRDDRLRRFDLAREISRLASISTLEYFQSKDLKIDSKEDHSPVTLADRQAERLLRDAIAKAFPQDGIIGEEFGSVTGTTDFVWILDPIDGTKSFICGVPLYSTLVAVLERDQPIIGVIELPALDETIFAMIGEGAWHRRGDQPPVPAQVSQCRRLDDAVFVTSERSSFDACAVPKAFSLLEQRCRITRTWGDGYGYALVATGRADLMIDPMLKIWDAAPMPPILSEAGGLFTDWRGDVNLDSVNGLATNRQLFGDVLHYLRSS